MQSAVLGARLAVVEGNLRGIRGLTVDGFGALLDGGPARLPSVLSQHVPNQRHEPTQVADLWRNRLRKHLRSEPFITFREVYRRTFQDVLGSLGLPDSVEECVEATLDEYRKAKAHPEVPRVLKSLEQEVPFAVVSNMDTAALLAALLANRLTPTFVVTSDEEQKYKPDPAPFRRAARYLGLPLDHIVHVGDSYADDVLGASSVGMHSLLIHRDIGRPPLPPGVVVETVRNLEEVRKYIERSWEDG